MPDLIIPPRKKPSNENGYFEILTKAVFQAGFSWKVVERKWEGFREVFNDFNPKIIAKWDETRIIKVLENPFIIRNEKKIRATVQNAQKFLEIIMEFGSFYSYLQTINTNPYQTYSNILVKQFKWLGRTGAYFFLWSVDEHVPEWENR